MKKILLLFIFLSASVNASFLYKIDNGIDLYRKNEYQKAIDYLIKYINSNPNDENGYFWLAKSYDALDDNTKALLNFKKAYSLALNDKNIDKIEFENNEFDNLEDYFDMAASYYEEANYKEALNYADMMLKIDPDCASAYFIKAKISYITGDKVSAEDYLNKAIILNNELLKTKLANTLNIHKIPSMKKEDLAEYAQKAYFKGDIDLCIDYLKKYLELNKENADIHILLVDCYLKNMNMTDAKSALEQAKKLFENNVSLILKEAEIIKIENPDDNKNYEEILLKAYNINPNNKNVLLKLADFYLDINDYQSAKKYFETLLNIDDNLYEAYFGYIYSLIKIQDIEKAQSTIRTMSSIHKNSAEINYLLSLICFSKSNYQEALEYINNAIKEEQNHKYLLQASKISYMLGDYDSSIKYLNPIKNTKEAQEFLILDLLKLKNIDELKKLVNSSTYIDKNSILYKYILYKIYKSESKAELNSILKQKPVSLQDYIDIAKINYLENKSDEANKILNNASKKFNNIPEIKYIQQEFQYK